MKLFKIPICGAILLFPLTTVAQINKIQIEAEIRPRVMVNGGYKTPKTNGKSTLAYTTQRIRLNARFVIDKLESYVSFQDVKFWGDDDNYKSSGVYGNTESLCLHQAWVKFNVAKPLSIKVGRQVFSYDNERIISQRNWNDYQVAYDALLMQYKTDKHRLHLGFT